MDVPKQDGGLLLHKSLKTEQADQDLIQRKRNDQGMHECEVLGSGPEAQESAYAWDNCSKNPGHPHCIPAPEFCLEHLPHWCRRHALFEYFQKVSALTVKLRVGYTSWGRPDGYTFSNVRGTHIVHTGTGLINDVEPGAGPCRCPDCASSDSPHQEWYQVFINTACHVVYNGEEARCTQVDVFYDDEAARRDGRMKTMRGISGSGEEDVDRSTLICATHDIDLAYQLMFHLDQPEIRYECQAFAMPDGFWRYLCVIVSHPHGQPKKVTVGEMKKWKSQSSQKQFTYNASTCPGSSGAFVPVVESIEVVKGVHWKTNMNWNSIHSEGLTGGLNRSCFSFYHAVSDTYRPLWTRMVRFALVLTALNWLCRCGSR